MRLSPEAQKIYSVLVERQQATPPKVITYEDVFVRTKIHPRVQRTYLAEIFQRCEVRKLPPLTSIVVQKGSEYQDGRYATPADGYHLEDAESPNLAGRDRSPNLKVRTERHQDSAGAIAVGRRSSDEPGAASDHARAVIGRRIG